MSWATSPTTLPWSPKLPFTYLVDTTSFAQRFCNTKAVWSQVCAELPLRSSRTKRGTAASGRLLPQGHPQTSLLPFLPTRGMVQAPFPPNPGRAGKWGPLTGPPTSKGLRAQTHLLCEPQRDFTEQCRSQVTALYSLQSRLGSRLSCRLWADSLGSNLSPNTHIQEPNRAMPQFSHLYTRDNKLWSEWLQMSDSIEKA